MRAGATSQDFDPAQLWLRAGWVLSEGGRPLRRPLATELCRLLDAVITGEGRSESWRVGSSHAE